MPGITPEERLRATAIVHGRMLEKLWVEYLARFDERIEEADAIEPAIRETIEDDCRVLGGRDVEVTLEVAVEILDAMWRDIRAEIAENTAPLTLAVTELGRKAARSGLPRKGGGDGLTTAPDDA